MRTAHSLTRAIALGSLFAAGCSTTKTETKPDNSGGDEQTQQTARPTRRGSRTATASTNSGPPVEQHPARANRAFDDAVAASTAQNKSGQPDYPDLERRFKQVIAIDDTYAEAHYNLGVVYERERKLDQAAEEYQKALSIKPTLSAAQENLAVMQENAGKADEANATYQKMAEQNPQDGGSRARMAALYQAGGQQDEAIKLAREALMRDPKNLTAYKVLMKVYLEQKNYSMAQLFALRATKLDNTDPELYHTIGLILLHQGDEGAAQDQFRKAIAARDDYLPSRLALAAISAKHHDWAGAAAQYQKLVALEPKNATAHLDLGIALRGVGQPDKAFAEYEQVKKLDDTNAEVYYAEGLIYEKVKSDPAKALENYKEFIAKGGSIPGDHPVYESIKNCEQIIQVQQQAKDQEEADKQKAKDDAEKKAEEDKLKADEAKQKAEDDKQKAAEAKENAASAPAPAGGSPPPADAAPAAAPAGGTAPPPAAKAGAAPGSTAPPPAAKPATPAAGPAPSADEPGGE